MQTKDSKKTKNNNNQSNTSSTNNKYLEDNILINKLIPKNKNSKIITNNNSNSNILKTKPQESKVNTSNSNQNKLSKNSINVEKEKKTKNIHIPVNSHEKKNEKKTGKITKQKTPSKLNNLDKSKKPKIMKKTVNETKKKPLIKSKTVYDDKRKKCENNSYKLKNEKKEKLKQKDEKDNGFNTQKLLEFLISLSPIDTSKCDDLISNNMNKIIELENKIAEITKNTQIEILKITNDENNNNNKITTKQNLGIINIESNMRKDIYKLFFNFITELLEQINKLSNNIANQEINDINLKDSSSSNDNLFINNSNNVSDMSYNSLFVSNIEEEFCEKLINITKSFIGSDIDLLDLKSNFDIDEKNKKNENEILFDDDNKVIDNNSNDYNCILKSRSKKMFMIHPNEILNKIQNEDNKNKKVIHHYSNSLKVNSNLEKLEGKINNDDDNMNSDTIGSFGNLEKLKNCNIF